MPKSSAKPKLETATCAPLTLPPIVDKAQAADKLLDVIFEMAVGGDLAAAKLFLDYILKRGSTEPAGISAEDALKLVGDHAGQMNADSPTP